MKIIVIGDPHFKVNNSHDTDLMVTAVRDLIQERQPDFIVCLGDLLDRHETIHVNPLDRATAFLKILSDTAPTYLLIGNHDRPNNSNFLTTEHPFNSHKYWTNLTIVDTIIRRTHGGLDFLFAPYVPVGRFEEALKATGHNLQGITAVFSHQEWRGVKMGAIVSEVGDIWSLDNPLSINGHIHDHDWTQANLVCVGTPYQLNYGEAPDKAIMEFTFTTNEISHVRLPVKIPKKQIVHLRLTEIETLEVPEEAPEYWKIILHGTSSEMKQITKHPKVREWIKRRIKVVQQLDLESGTPTPAIGNNGITFLERLRQAATHDPILGNLIEEILGN